MHVASLLIESGSSYCAFVQNRGGSMGLEGWKEDEETEKGHCLAKEVKELLQVSLYALLRRTYENTVTHAVFALMQCRQSSLISTPLSHSRPSIPRWTFKPNPRLCRVPLKSTLHLRMMSRCARMVILRSLSLALPLVSDVGGIYTYFLVCCCG